jgi:glycosyltransferase involved in cell wall biosynthesis
MSSVRASIVIPAHNEGDNIITALTRIAENVSVSHEVLIVVDNENDTTIEAFCQYSEEFPQARVLQQSYGRGPAHAIRFGFDSAKAPCTVVTMADGSDDARIIDDLVFLIERGCVIAAGSRYMPGGAQIGGPKAKKIMSRVAGLSLNWLGGVSTHDATNSFKAYSTEFVRSVSIDSRGGFEIAIELVAKARRLRLPIAELPTIWLDRDLGISSFELQKWLPSYFAWYRFAFGPKLDLNQLRKKSVRLAERYQ